MSWYGDPEGLHAHAVQLSAAAARCRDRAADVRASAARAHWRGPAADAFHASIARESALVDRAADELDDAARALHRHADAVRHEIDRLLAAERAAQHAVVGGLSHVADGLSHVAGGLSRMAGLVS
ncbi:MAG: hypothetical protein QOI82_942 [Actinomycetota bacterium]|jgi:uncharacterized protein YukE|nr:hypothetical protein [Actinomycetota bacterium]